MKDRTDLNRYCEMLKVKLEGMNIKSINPLILNNLLNNILTKIILEFQNQILPV